MKVKRYFAANMRSALDMIKQDQGPDVLILSNRKVDGGVELITADQLTEQESERLARNQLPQRRPDVAVAVAPGPVPAAKPATRSAHTVAGLDPHELLWTDANVVSQMRDELNNLKGLLESQLGSFCLPPLPRSLLIAIPLPQH